MSVYDGWTNYKTWAVYQWATNPGQMNLTVNGMADDAENVNELADGLKEFFQNQAPQFGGSVWDDLLTSALSDVDWHKLAEHFYYDLHPEERPTAAGKVPEGFEVFYMGEDDIRHPSMTEHYPSAGWYWWECPNCGRDNRELAYNDTLTCHKCKAEAQAKRPKHTYFQ